MAAAVDVGLVLSRLTLVNQKRTSTINLLQALTGDPTIEQTIDGASTLTLDVADPRRELVTAKTFGQKLWATFEGVNFELVSISKQDDTVSLTFEDAVVAALRRRTDRLSIRPGTITRADFAARLCKEAKVPYAVDTTARGPVRSALGRSNDGQTTSSWDVLGDAASAVNWRRFSDGKKLIMGGDPWLMARDNNPTRIREFAGAVQGIDFDLDTGKKASEATVTVDVAAWALPPGSLVLVEDLGPANGKWLVSGYSRTVTSPRGTVNLVRAQHVLTEAAVAANATTGDSGDPDYLPGKQASDDGGKAATPAREAMVRWALKQSGKPYVWGAHGPNAFDCSGLVQEATRAAGHVLPAPSGSQWAAVKAAGRTMSISDGLATRGALLWMGPDGSEHVAISLGNGKTMEARGTAYGVGVFNAETGSYTSAGWWV